ncbi:MAG TPA: alpha/beta hydrolase [Candidatus Dormibacteraeota bacterium]|jgi:pimeloyl-ACP methyl ester carboxylesterase|nr:alpha/beta hydrolase [Candidatus Dormibacteraeota bacterium]
MWRATFCLILFFHLALSTLGYGQAANPPSPPRESFKNAAAQYDWVTNVKGQRIRTIVTRPKNASGKVPAIFFVGWLSCDSVEYVNGETDAFGAIFWRLIEQSGFATMRMDKPGVGESQGDCAKTDFQTELDSYRAAFESLPKHSFVDQDKIFVVGLSNGGGTSPLVAGNHSVRGYVAASSWGRTWYEHMLELERGRLSHDSQLPPAQITDSMKGFSDFYSLYLMHGQTPGQILTARPEWKSLWYDEPDGQYGRPAAFYQQLQALNLGKVWQEVSAPVLVLHGTADTIMSRADSFAIADTVNRTHPGNAEFVEIEGGDHLLASHDKLIESVVPKILEWMQKQSNSSR